MPKKTATTSRTFILFLVLLVIQLTLYLYTTYRPFTIAPPGYSYTVMGWFYSYPNFILQAKDGAWGIIDATTTRQTPRVYTQSFLVLLGKIAWLFHLHQITMYRIAQTLGGIAVFFATYQLIRLLLPHRYHAAAILFALGIEIGPLINSIAGHAILSWAPSFDSQITFNRHFGLPHHVWAEVFGLLFLITLYQSVKKISVYRLGLLIVLAFAVTITLPSYVITMMLGIVPVWFFWALSQKKLRQFLVPLAIASAVIILTGIFIKMQFAQGLPWKNFPTDEKTWWTNHDQFLYYFSSLTLYYPWFYLAVAAVLSTWKTLEESTKFAFLICLAWVLSPVLFIPFSTTSWFPIANFRLTDGYHYPPAGILAAIGYVNGLSFVKQKNVRSMIVNGLLALTLVASIGLTAIFTKQLWANQEALWSNVYPKTSTMQAVYFLDTLPKHSGILVREHFGNIITAFADVRVFLGAYHFPDYPERSWLADRFLSGALSDTDAKTLLHDNDIQYIFYGPEEQERNTTGTLYPDILSPIYTTDSVTVFAIKK